MSRCWRTTPRCGGAGSGPPATGRRQQGACVHRGAALLPAFHLSQAAGPPITPTRVRPAANAARTHPLLPPQAVTSPESDDHDRVLRLHVMRAKEGRLVPWERLLALFLVWIGYFGQTFLLYKAHDVVEPCSGGWIVLLLAGAPLRRARS